MTSFSFKLPMAAACAALAGAFAANAALAQSSESSEKPAEPIPHRKQLTVYYGQGVDSNLPELLPDAVQGKLKFEDSYMMALGYFHPLGTPKWLQWVFDTIWIPNSRIGLEGVVVKHWGLQHNWETDGAFSLRFAPWHVGGLRIRAGLGVGLSYAFGTPSYEDGPSFDPDRRYRLQNYNFYELEWSAPSMSDKLSIVTRVHHRSGIYGVVAPRRVGSNFITIGARYSF